MFSSQRYSRADTGLIGSEVQVYPNMIYQKAIAIAYNAPSLTQLASPSRASPLLAPPATLGMALCSASVAAAVCVVTGHKLRQEKRQGENRWKRAQTFIQET